MRSPGIRLHKLALFGWAVVVTAVLLLLSLPVLAGKIVPALNLANCWKLCNINYTESAGNLLSLHFLGFFRDYTPKFICCIGTCFYGLHVNSSYIDSFYRKLNMDYVKEIKTKMNDNRTIFVWDHLQNFYNLNK